MITVEAAIVALRERRRGILLGFACLAFAGLFLGSSLARTQVSVASVGGSGLPPSAEALPGQAAGSEAPGDDRGLYYKVYTVAKGDTIGQIADREGVTTDTIVSFNDITNTRAVRPGLLLRIPSQAGILYRIKEGDTIEALAAAYSISADSIIESNGLLSERLAAGAPLFLPDARLPSFTLREINGDLFRWPVSGYISSRYGWRTDPFSGARGFHNGMDIATSYGRPVRAAMEGRVRDTGYSPAFGNYILIGHHSGYASFYGHLSSIKVVPGQAVALGQQIGSVGNSGYSTGPHLHFTVFKFGSTLNPAILLH